MVTEQKGTPCWKFADAQFDERALQLTVGGTVVELERKPLEVLRLLMRAGEAVSHKKFPGAVRLGRILSESALKKCVSRLSDVPRVASLAVLLLHNAGRKIRLTADKGSCFVGRGKDCLLRIGDSEARISSRHLLFEHAGGRWFVQDISRNGTWLRGGTSGETSLLPYCARTLLPPSGVLCLSSDFANDPEGSRAWASSYAATEIWRGRK